MQGKPKEQIEELEKMIISAEIEKVAHPYNKEECDTSIKQCYTEISKITKDTEHKVRKRNVALAAALMIVTLFGFTLSYLNLAPDNLDGKNEVTGFAFYTGPASTLLKTPINESLSPSLSSVGNAVGEEFAKQNEIVKEEVEKKQ